MSLMIAPARAAGEELREYLAPAEDSTKSVPLKSNVSRSRR